VFYSRLDLSQVIDKLIVPFREYGQLFLQKKRNFNRAKYEQDLEKRAAEFGIPGYSVLKTWKKICALAEVSYIYYTRGL